MRRLLAGLALVVAFHTPSWATTISLPKTWASGDTLTAADLNNEFTTISNDYNGSITPANFSTTMTFTSTQYLDLSAITASTAKGLRLPIGTGGTNAGNLTYNATTARLQYGDGTVSQPVDIYFVGTFTRDTSLATGTQAVTGVGFKPRAAWFLANQAASREMSWGFDDGTNTRAILDDAATADTYNINASNSILDSETSSNDYDGKISTLDTDGFTISWTRNGTPTGTLTVYYIAVR